ncbi:cupin [Candidatus Pacearchaeota archaeon]|nr:cupin [Candidatus Pacearchaeota archaeon]|tara:strand:+ start:2941 stop:3297 length:357 start_codon:yes stop_codon:yes gene_type:complete
MTSKIIKKPWGFEEIWAQTEGYVGKFLTIYPDNKLSLQYHEKKEETIRVISGDLFLHYGTHNHLKIDKLQSGDTFHITPGTVHRFEAKSTEVLLAEVSTPELLDVVRIEDDYGRADSD